MYTTWGHANSILYQSKRLGKREAAREKLLAKIQKSDPTARRGNGSVVGDNFPEGNVLLCYWTEKSMKKYIEGRE